MAKKKPGRPFFNKRPALVIGGVPLSHSGSFYLPASIRREMGLIPGDTLDLAYQPDKDRLIITRGSPRVDGGIDDGR